MLTDGRTGRTDRRTLTDDGRKVITIAHPEQSSGEKKNVITPRGPGIGMLFVVCVCVCVFPVRREKGLGSAFKNRDRHFFFFAL